MTCDLATAAIDISDVALERLRGFAAARGLDVETQRVDLDDSSALDVLEPGFDLIVISHFKPNLRVWPKLVGLLKPGGHLVLTTFNTLQHDRTGFHRGFCLMHRELANVHPDLELLHYQRFHERDAVKIRDLDGYLFRRR